MSEALNIVKASFGGLREVTTAPLWQWDYGQILEITGLDLPQAFEVHFSNSRKSGETVTQIGTDNQVTIPDMYLTSGADIYAFVFLHDGTDDGETEYVVKIPVRERPEPSDIEPTPEQQDVITEAIAALNTAVTQTGQDVISADASAQAAAQSATDAQTAARSAQGSATSASGSATTATNAASTATTKASEAATSAVSAASAKTAAETAETNAQAAQTASESAQASAASAAQTATTKASEAAASAASASGSASAASASASQASESATQASQSATAASGSATSAATSASTASTKASEASASVTAANTAKTAAEAAQTAAETAQTEAEAARDETVAEATSIRGLLKDKADIIISTAEGAIATFEDGGYDLPMVSCVAKIEPVQDLHGYDHPWPAGGGKNKAYILDASFTNNGVSVVCSASAETVTLKGTATNSGGRYNKLTRVITLPAGSYVVSATAISGTKQATYIVSNAGTDGYISGSTFTLSEETPVYIGANVANGTTYDEVVRLQIESGSTATPWTPYSNICPISGWTEATASRTGVNLLDTTGSVNGGINADGSVKANPADSRKVTKMLSVKPNTAYYFWNVVPASDGRSGYWYDASGNGIRLINLSGSSASSGTVTSPANAAYCRVNYLATNENICMMSLGTTPPTSYEPYSGTTYPISWQSEAGTVYGGTVDLVSGVLTVDRYFMDPSQWTRDNASNGYIAYRTDVIPNGRYMTDGLNKPISNMIATFGSFSSSAMSRNIIQPPRSNSNTAYMALQDGLDPTNVELSYLILDPITIQLTPTEVRTLLGLNNVWADTGDVEVQYRADTKLYIDGKRTDWAKLIAPTEAAYTATRAYTSSSLLIVGSQLYKATTAIANGATLTVGTNITATTLAEVIAAL